MKLTPWLVVLVGCLLGVRAVDAESYHIVVSADTNSQGKANVTIVSTVEPQPKTNLSVQAACQALREVKGSGSMVQVLIVSKDGRLADKDLKELLGAIAENPWLHVAYVRNGIDATTAESIVRSTKTESAPHN
jgi:hypothetical protein